MELNLIFFWGRGINDHQNADYYKDGNKIDLDKIEEQFNSMIDIINSNNDIFYKKYKIQIKIYVVDIEKEDKWIFQ